MSKFSFPKQERLYKRDAIQELFNRGSSFYIHPFKVLSLQNQDGKTHQVIFSVSKHNFRRAVDRNLIKRRMREAYRLNKLILPESPKLQIAYIYTPKEILIFDRIQEKLIESLKRLSKEYAEKI